MNDQFDLRKWRRVQLAQAKKLPGWSQLHPNYREIIAREAMGQYGLELGMCRKMEKIAKARGVNVKTVRRAFDRGVAAGVLVKVRRKRTNGSQTTNSYFFVSSVHLVEPPSVHLEDPRSVHLEDASRVHLDVHPGVQGGVHPRSNLVGYLFEGGHSPPSSEGSNEPFRKNGSHQDPGRDASPGEMRPYLTVPGDCDHLHNRA